jgi:molecular chaperone DnaK
MNERKKNKEADEKKKELVEVRNQAEAMLHSTKKIFRRK